MSINDKVEAAKKALRAVEEELREMIHEDDEAEAFVLSNLCDDVFEMRMRLKDVNL